MPHNRNIAKTAIARDHAGLDGQRPDGARTRLAVMGARPEHTRRSRENPDRRELAPRSTVTYFCPQGHTFELNFAEDVPIPQAWECRGHSVEAALAGNVMAAAAKVSRQSSAAGSQVRAHDGIGPWWQLRERRTISQLERGVAEILVGLAAERDEQLDPDEVERQLRGPGPHSPVRERLIKARNKGARW